MNLGFQRCVNDWCYQHGTNEQYTKCKNASEDGRTCYNPTIRYGTAIGGRPRYPGPYDIVRDAMTLWCRQLFPEYNMLTGYASYHAKYEGYKGWLLWCDYGDEKNPHWCNPEGVLMKWKDCQSCLGRQYPNGISSIGMKSVTCKYLKNSTRVRAV